MENLKTQLFTFWAIVKDVWDSGVFGYSIGDALVAIVIFLVFYALRGAFRRFVVSIIQRWYQKREREGKLDDIIAKALSGPLQLAFVAFGIFVALQYVGLRGELGVLGDRIVRSMIAIAIFWAVYNLIIPLSDLLYKLNHILTREMIDWLVKGVRWAVIFVGAATVLQIWGIQVGPVLAGLGLFGVAVALGAQELFRNLIGGLCILIEKQFRKGEWIRVDGVVEGTVEHIGFRSTMIRRFDQAPVSVPNMKLSDAAVTNFSRMRFRRIFWTIPLDYRTTVEQLKTIREQIEAYLRGNDAFVQPPEGLLFVRVDSFNDSSVDLMIYTFTRTIIWGEWLEHKEKLALRIKEIVEGNGARFAISAQTIFVEHGEQETPAWLLASAPAVPQQPPASGQQP